MNNEEKIKFLEKAIYELIYALYFETYDLHDEMPGTSDYGFASRIADITGMSIEDYHAIMTEYTERCSWNK